MAYIPFDKMKSLREAAKNGDTRARKIIIMQMNGEDFGSLLDEYFTKQPKDEKPVATSTPIIEDNDITDPKLKKFLEYNGVKKGDQDYESTIEAYYQEFPKARPGAKLEMKATNADDDVVLPNDEDDDSSIYGEEDEEIEDNVKFDSPAPHRVQETVATEEKNCIDILIEDEYEAIEGYDKAITQIMRMDLSNAIKKGLIADLEEIRRDEFEHVEKLKRMKENSIKKEEQVI